MKIRPHHINTTGYLKGKRTNRNKVNVIPSRHITTKGMTRPILANGHVLHPDTGDFIFPHAPVVEQPIPKAKLGHTVRTPQYLSTYPNDRNTTPTPMIPKKSVSRRAPGSKRTFDPQLGAYKSNIYLVGGLTYPGYPYAGYNDSERGMYSGMMQQGGSMYPAIYQGAPPPPAYFLAHAQMGGPMPQPGPAGAMPQPGMMVPPGMPPGMPPPQMGPPPRRGGKGLRPKGGKRGRMQGGGNITPESVAAARASGYDDVTGLNNINMILTGGKYMPSSTPAQSQLATQAMIYRQTHPGAGPEQSIQGFFSRPIGSSSGDSLRQVYRNIGYGPVSMYNNTHNVGVNPHSNAAIAANFQIGGSTSVPSYRTTKITSRFHPDQTDGEMDDDWKDVFYDNPDMKKGGHWIQGAINPKHKGFCTPMSKPTCTGRRRALALLFKRKHGFHKHQAGGEYLQGFEMQGGGYPESFTPAGSLIDQNTWAMTSEGTAMVPPTGNYYKTDPSQTSLTGALPGQPATTPLTNMHRPYRLQQNVNNHPVLQALLPINAGLSSVAQHNDWRQRQTSSIQAQTNPLSTMAYDNGRTPESRFGYSTFQGGGETMPFAGIPLHLWQRGGVSPGAAQSFRPYMLHQGRFQMGGESDDLMDQWDMEDAQDGAGSSGGAPPAGVYDEDQGYNSEISRRANLSNDEDYNAALEVAMSKSVLNNPYLW